MSQIQIQILAGPLAGRRRAFSEPPITFGREGDNHLVVPEQYVSRKHGEIEVRDGDWYLINHSPNETYVGKKRVKRRPVRLRDQDVVRVGDQPLFEVLLPAPAPPAAQDEPAEATDQASAGASQPRPRKTIWVTSGIIGISLLLTFILLTLDKSPADGPPEAPNLTRDQIVADIRAPANIDQINPRLAQQKLTLAREYWEKRNILSDGTYMAHQEYKKALAYADANSFDAGLDQRRFQTLEQTLIDEVSRRYREAEDLLKSGQYREAEDAFRSLSQFYRATSGTIYEAIERQRSIASHRHQEMSKRRRF